MTDFAADDPAFIALLCRLALRAGSNAMRYYRTEIEADSKADNSPVTIADREGEALISAGLQKAFPDIQIIGEESASDNPPQHIAPAFFLLDPLDGTSGFLDGATDFTINIGYVEKTVPKAGVVYAPALSRLFFTLDGKAFESNAPADAATADAATADSAIADSATADNFSPAKLTTHARRIKSRPPPAKGMTALTSRAHRAPQTDAYLQTQAIEKILPISSSLKFCLLASGEADLYPRYGATMEWDTAAGQAILEAAGGRVVDMDGHALTYGRIAQGLVNPPFIAHGQ